MCGISFAFYNNNQLQNKRRKKTARKFAESEFKLRCAHEIGKIIVFLVRRHLLLVTMLVLTSNGNFFFPYSLSLLFLLTPIPTWWILDLTCAATTTKMNPLWSSTFQDMFTHLPTAGLCVTLMHIFSHKISHFMCVYQCIQSNVLQSKRGFIYINFCLFRCFWFCTQFFFSSPLLCFISIDLHYVLRWRLWNLWKKKCLHSNLLYLLNAINERNKI